MRNRPFQLTVVAASALALAATPAHSQDGLGGVEKLFEEVSAVTVFYQWGRVVGSDDIRGDNLRGAGTEVLIDLNDNSEGVTLELGLGASFLRGYAAVDTTLDLHTSLRALPTVSLYASKGRGRFDVFGGISFGLAELWSAQAYDKAGRAWDIEARTFELGFSGGLYWTHPAGFGVFTEAGYRKREFPAVKWTLPEGQTLPESWPRTLDFSGSYLQLGAQFRVKEDDRNDEITPPAPSGVWTLERMDGAELPGVLSATATDTTQLLHAVLRLTPSTATNAEEGSGSWTLDLQRRKETTAGVITFEPDSFSGTYTTADKRATREHVLTLVPDNKSGGTRQAERLAGRLYLNWEGHMLIFAPGNAPPKKE
jgi:hypothetical protein